MAVLDVQNLTLSFGENVLFDGVSFDVKEKDKVGLIGCNGAGKSTFLKIINGTREADKGELTYGHNVKLSYFAQEFENFDNDKNLFDELLYNTDLTSKETRDLLAKFMFVGDDIFKSVNNLSGGEKCRLALAKIMANKPNLLILDEPTNHLDITSCEILENAINDFEGTVIIVSHDRYFLDKTTKLTIEIKNGKFTKYFGPYSYYKEKCMNFTKNITKQNKNSKSEVAKPLNNRQIRELIKPLQKQNTEIENKITETEKIIDNLTLKLTDENIYKDGSAKEITLLFNQTQNELDDYFKKWENIQKDIDTLTKMLK